MSRICHACRLAGLATVLALGWTVPARAEFFHDVRRTFQTDIPHFFQDDIPCAFGGGPTSGTKASCKAAKPPPASGKPAAPDQKPPVYRY